LLAGPVKDLLDRIISPLQPVQVFGPSIQFHSSSVWDGPEIKSSSLKNTQISKTVTLINNDESDWIGDVKMMEFNPKKEISCSDLLLGVQVPHKKVGRDVLLAGMQVKSFDVSVIRCNATDLF
jgi:hypothetical protein